MQYIPIVILLFLLITALPAAILILVIGFIKHHPGWGFGLGFLPIILFGLLLRPGLANPPGCPPPPALCEGPAIAFLLGIAVTVIYLLLYLISAFVIYLIYRYRRHQRTRVTESQPTSS
jgi:hypothetical protein